MFYARVSWIRPTTRVGKTGQLQPPGRFQASFRFYKKGDVHLWF